MELSGIELHYLVNKISSNISSGYYVSNISSITKNSILLKLHHPIESDIMLMISTKGIWFTNQKYRQVEEGQFVNVLSREIERAKINSVSQPGSERIFFIHFVNRDDKERKLIVEIFGKGNIILCDESMRILWILLPVEVRHRTLKIGSEYILPPNRGEDVLKISLNCLKKSANLQPDNTEVVKWLSKSTSLPRKYLEEIILQSGINTKYVNLLNDYDIEIIYEKTKEITNKVIDERNHNPSVILDNQGLVVDASPITISKETNVRNVKSYMPVAAREASIYTGVTMAEYYRDMGYDVVLVADSTSRWAEALREMSGRLEEMPAEEGYPSYLASRLAEFYERAGRIRALGSPDRSGSVTLVGAVSPSGADFTEPVTTHTIRFIKTFWALDTRLAYSRHYPSINWMQSYSGYLEDISKWWKENVSPDWYDLRAESYHILQREDTLKEIVRLLGPEALPDEEKLVLEVARMIKIGILQQNSFDKVDTYCGPAKQLKLVRLMVKFYKEAQKALKEGKTLADIRALPIITTLLKAKFEVTDEQISKFEDIEKQLSDSFKGNVEEVKVSV